MIKAKFKVDVVTEFVGGKQVKLSAVANGSNENKDYAHYTPSGDMSFSISPETKAYEYFRPGQEIYLAMSTEPIEAI